MFHIFNVNCGQTLALDVASAVGSVKQLREALHSEIRVPVDDQVLLMSGGEVPEMDRQVASYRGVGTESNPLFLVCKIPRGSAGSSQRVGCSTEVREIISTLAGLKEDVEEIRKMKPSFECIHRSGDLAERFIMACQSASQACARLVHEQHLLYQGWQALVSNLEDTVTTFKKRTGRFEVQYTKLKSMKTRAAELLNTFDSDLQILALIPFPACLLKVKSSTKVADSNWQPSTLLDWISASDPENSLDDVARKSNALLSEVNDNILEEIGVHSKAITDQAANKEMKEIKGISKRFAQLDQHLRISEEFENEQRKLCELIRSQEEKALKGVRDAATVESIGQVQMTTLDRMLRNGQRTAEIAERFAQSKSEVLNNVRLRLTDWIIQTHQQLHHASSQLAIYGTKLNYLIRCMDVIRQVHEAPTIYAAAVSEVIRRSTFREDYMRWAQRLVEKTQSVASEESRIRETFSSKLNSHFLRTLFTGMNDQMPQFATRLPTPFDSDLPPLEAEHLRQLRTSVPSLAPLLTVTDPDLLNRLSIYQPPSAPISQSSEREETTVDVVGGGMKREESFFNIVPGPSLSALVRSFPSTTWLSGDENLEFSPNSTGLMIARSPPSAPGLVRPQLSVPALSPLGFPQQQVPKEPDDACAEECASSSAKSAPIRIPSRAPSDGMSTSRQLSEKSSRFGTPEETFATNIDSDEDHFSPPEIISRSQFRKEVEILAEEVSALASDGKSEEMICNKSADSSAHLIKLETELISAKEELMKRSEALEQCQSVISQQKTLLSNGCGLLKQELVEMKASVCDMAQMTTGLLQDKVSMVGQSAVRLESQLQKNVALAQMATTELLREQHEQALRAIQQQLQVEKTLVHDAEKRVGNFEALVNQKDDVIALLEERVASTEKECEGKVEEVRSEVIKQLTIEYELQLDDMRRAQRDILQSKEVEVADIRHQLEEKSLILDRLRKDNDHLVMQMCDRQQQQQVAQVSSSVVDESILTEKMTALKMAHEAELKNVRAEMELAFKSKVQLLTKGMEDRQAEVIARHKKETQVDLSMKEAKITDLEMKLKQFGKEEEGKVPAGEGGSHEPPAQNTQWTSSMTMTDSAIGPASEQAASPTTEEEEEMEEEQRDKSSPLSTSVAIMSQTRLRSRDLNAMIFLQDIHQGCRVLVVWNDTHAAYVLFSTSPTMYIVKERSVHNLGLSTRTPEHSWSIATVASKCEFCQIMKANNRYKLPVGTRFYRVDLEPVSIDSMPTASRRSTD